MDTIEATCDTRLAAPTTDACMFCMFCMLVETAMATPNAIGQKKRIDMMMSILRISAS